MSARQRNSGSRITPHSRGSLGGSAERACLRLDRGWWVASGKGASAGKEAYWVGAWQGEQLAPAAIYRGHTYIVTAVTASHDATLAASGDAFGEIHVWDPRTASRRWVFRSLGKPIYNVSFDAASRKLAFGTTPYPKGRWDRNQFGELQKTFDFSTRAIQDRADSAHVSNQVTQGNRSLKLEWRTGNFHLESYVSAKLEQRYKVRTGVSPMCYSFLRSPRLGLETPVIYGDDHGGVACYNPRDKEERREFAGHQAFVTGLSESADGRFLATSSMDRTLRLWSLEGYRAWGDFDFEYLSNAVTEVKPGSSAERAGIKVGDKIITMDGRNLTDLEKLMLSGEYPYRPGQRVPLEMERAGRRFQTQIALKEGYDLVEPLVSLFMTEQGEWVAWTPQGYYDSSPGADRLIGWHVNHCDSDVTGRRGGGAQPAA